MLDPLLFLTYINDISDHLSSLVRLFADDTSLSYASTNLHQIERKLNSDINILNTWAETWLVKFNPQKTEFVIFSNNKNIDHVNIPFNGKNIKQVEYHTHLGVCLSSNCKWCSSGSVLGPLLFPIYINDISDHLSSLVRLFADDTSLSYASTNLHQIERKLNSDINILNTWAETWLVKFNPQKTEFVIFSYNKNIDHINILFNGENIKQVEYHTHLGVCLSSNCKH